MLARANSTATQSTATIGFEAKGPVRKDLTAGELCNNRNAEVPILSLACQRTFESLCEHVARIRASQTPQIAHAGKVLPSLLDRIFNS